MKTIDSSQPSDTILQ